MRHGPGELRSGVGLSPRLALGGLGPRGEGLGGQIPTCPRLTGWEAILRRDLAQLAALSGSRGSIGGVRRLGVDRFSDELGHLPPLGRTEDLRILLQDRQGFGHLAVALLHQFLLGLELFDFGVEGFQGGQGQRSAPVGNPTVIAHRS